MAKHSEDSAPTLCRRCWCVTWTSDLGRCGKCDARKEDGDLEQQIKTITVEESP